MGNPCPFCHNQTLFVQTPPKSGPHSSAANFHDMNILTPQDLNHGMLQKIEIAVDKFVHIFYYLLGVLICIILHHMHHNDGLKMVNFNIHLVILPPKFCKQYHVIPNYQNESTGILYLSHQMLTQCLCNIKLVKFCR